MKNHGEITANSENYTYLERIMIPESEKIMKDKNSREQ
jgi:hypothetical protein